MLTTRPSLMTFVSASQFHVYLPCVTTLIWAFSAIVKTDGSFAALIKTQTTMHKWHHTRYVRRAERSTKLYSLVFPVVLKQVSRRRMPGASVIVAETLSNSAGLSCCCYLFAQRIILHITCYMLQTLRLRLRIVFSNR